MPAADRRIPLRMQQERERGASLFRAKYRIASMRSHLVRLPSNTFASEFQGAFRVKELNCYGQPPLIL